MLLFHGTSLNRLKEIIKDGYLGTDNTIWNVSEGNTTYFYTEDFIKEEYGIEDKEEIKLYGINRGLESADFVLAQEKTNLKRTILIFNSEDLEKIGKLEKDNSCGDIMDYCVKFNGKIPIELIKEIWIDKENLDLLRIYFIGLCYSRNEGISMVNNETILMELDSELLEASLKLYENLAEWFMENYDIIESLEQTTIEKIKHS